MRLRERQFHAQRLSAHTKNRAWPVPSPFSSRETIFGYQDEETSLDGISPDSGRCDFVNSDDAFDKTSAVSSYRWLFVFARVYLGISFLFSDHGNARPDELSGFLKYALRNGYGWYQDLLNSVVVRHSSTFGTLVVIAEIYVGIALVLGFTTRLATLIAFFLLLNYMCAKGALPWGPGIDQSDIILALIILLGDAGRTFGLDKLIARRFPRLWVL